MKSNLHSKVSELEQRLLEGQISRRDFLRAAALLGVSLWASEVLAACNLKPAPEPTPTERFQPAIAYTDNIIPTPPGGEIFPPTAAPGEEPTLAARSTAPPPKPPVWLCTSCGLHFPNADVLKRHAATVHAKRLPEIQRIERPTYSEFLVGPVERFDERNTVFSRTAWDEPYIALVKAATAKAPQDDREAIEGRALIAGAIYADDTAGSLHPNYYGYFGHVREHGGLYGWDDPVNTSQFPVPDAAWMSERIKQVARLYGANLVGICQVDPRWVYSHYFERVSGNYGKLEIPYPYAVVMAIEMDWNSINESPGMEASAATALIYSRMAELSGSLAKYIRALGYSALSSGNDSAQSIPLAIDAGLGEIGRLGLLLTPEYGPRVRICKVFTDLPLQPDQPIDFGMRSFCENCHACAGACPVDAIPWEDRTTAPTSISNRKGILRWTVDVARCYLFWRENGVDCSNCIAACPWALQSTRDWLESPTG